MVHNLDQSYGGPANSIPYTAANMYEFGWHSTLAACRFWKEESNQVIQKTGLKWLSFGVDGPRVVAYSREMSKTLLSLVSSGAIDVVHLHNLWNFVAFLASRLSASAGVPLVISPRGSLTPWSLRRGRARKWLAFHSFQKRMLQNCSCIHVTSLQEMDDIVSLGIHNDFALIPNGVDTTEFDGIREPQYHRAQLGIDTARKYILFMSRVDPKKGLHLLIEAFGASDAVERGWELLIAGPTNDEAYWGLCRRVIEKHGLGSHVKYLGMLTGEKRLDAYGASNAFALPTFSENFGIAILEGLLAGLPTITTVNAPWQEIQTEGAGHVVSNDVPDLVRALDAVIAMNDRDVEIMSARAKAIAARYSWRTQAQKMHHLYEWLRGKATKPEFVYTR